MLAKRKNKIVKRVKDNQTHEKETKQNNFSCTVELSGSNTDGLSTTVVSKSFLSPLENLIAADLG